MIIGEFLKVMSELKRKIMKTEDRFLLSYLPKMIRNAKINFYTGEVVIEYEVEKLQVDPPKNKEHEWVYIRLTNENC